MKCIEDIRQEFARKYRNGEFTTDRTGVKTVEIIGESFLADEDSIFVPVNRDYVQRELEWYLSQSLNIKDIPGETPRIWTEVADKDGFINSNYGWCVFSEENGSQYSSCLNQLVSDPATRRAVMVYIRPGMQQDYKRNGMSDFICTCYTHQFVRDGKLIYIVYQRSCDAVFGFRNDLPWHRYVADKLVGDLRANGIEVDYRPEITFSCGSIHVYERHFKYLEEYLSKHE